MDDKQRSPSGSGRGDPRRNVDPPPQQPPYYYPYYAPPQQYFYPQQPPMYYSPFEQYQPQQHNEVTNPMLLQMFANQQAYYDPFGFGNMSPIMQQPPHVEERRIESALRAMILKEESQAPGVDSKPSVSPIIADSKEMTAKSTEIEATKSVNTPVEDREDTPVSKKKKKKLVRKIYSFDQSRDRLTEDMLELPDLKLTRDVGAKISKILIKLHKDLTPTKQELEKKEKFFNRLVGIIKGKWPEAELHIFGSSASQLGVRGNSDIDVCLVIKFEPRKRSNSRAIEPEPVQEELEPIIEQEEPTEDDPSKQDEYGDDDEEDDQWEQQDFSSDKRKKRKRKRYRKVPLSEEQALKKNYVSQLTQFLGKHHMRNVKPLFNARVPIVKFVDPDSGLNCDICVNNILAVHNTHLLRTYASLDIRCAQLIYVVKYWASMREINQPYHGTLSSYSYVLLTINYLQTLPNPVLPVLQDARQFPNATMKSTIVDGLDANNYECSYFDNVSTNPQGKEPKFITSNTDSVGELLAGFFRYYAFEFNFGRDVVTIRFTPDSAREQHKEGDVSSRYITKEEKGWTNYAEVRNAMCIEDPFETNFNVARTCTNEGLAQIQYELVRAYHLLCKQADLKASVCARLSHNKT
jgi:DNA polymerase sigma